MLRQLGQESPAREKHALLARLAPFDAHAVLELARVAGQLDAHVAGRNRPLMNQTDSRAADLPRHGGNRVASLRGDFGGKPQIAPLRLPLLRFPPIPPSPPTLSRI